MAEEDTDDERQEEGGESQPSFFAKKKKLIILVLLGLLLIGVSVGGTLGVIMMMSSPEPEAGAEADATSDEEAGPPPLQRAIYYPLKPPILVSFDGRGRQRLMQAEITLLTRENDVIAALETHMPMIRNALILLISGRTYDEIQTAEGKELLRVACLQELQRLMEQEIGKPGVEQVLFTGLVVQ